MKKSRRIAQLEAELAESRRFDAAGREMHAKSESDAAFLCARVRCLEETIHVLTRLLTESRAFCASHTEFKRGPK